MTLLQMSSDDLTEYSDSSEDSETPPPQPALERPKATLSYDNFRAFGTFVPRSDGCLDFRRMEYTSSYPLPKGRSPSKRLGADSGDVPPRGRLTFLDA